MLDHSSSLLLICIAHSDPSAITMTLGQLHSPNITDEPHVSVFSVSDKQKTLTVTAGRAEPLPKIGKGEHRASEKAKGTMIC